MKAIATVVCVGLLSPCGAMADEPRVHTSEDVELIFQSLDRDRDRRISKAEAGRESSLRKRFAGVDSNGDGYLSKLEFEARPSPEPFE